MTLCIKNYKIDQSHTRLDCRRCIWILKSLFKNGWEICYPRIRRDLRLLWRCVLVWVLSQDLRVSEDQQDELSPLVLLLSHSYQVYHIWIQLENWEAAKADSMASSFSWCYYCNTALRIKNFTSNLRFSLRCTLLQIL